MAPPVLKNLLTAFSPRGDYLAICAGDGRIKTWDTVSGSIRGDFADLAVSISGADPEVDGHLAVDYTCMAWNPATKKGKKKHGSSFLLGLGTGSGDVLLLDTALGQLKWRVQDCHPGGLKSLVFAKSGSIIYSTGVDGMVCALDLDSGRLLEKFRASKRAISCIAVSGDCKYLVAGVAELKLFELSSKKRLCKFTGHPDAVKALVYTDDDTHFFSSANGERHVALWHNYGSKKGAAAACSLSMEHPAVSLDCSGELSKSLRVLAVSEAGMAYVWHASSVEELSKVKPIEVSVALEKGEASPGSKSGKSSRSAVLAAKFIGKNEKGPGSVLVAFGTTVKPVFEQISLEGKGNRILLQANQNGALMPTIQVNDTAEYKDLSEATILGPDNAVDVEMPRAHLELEEATSKPSKRKKRTSIEEAQRVNMDHPKLYGSQSVQLDGVIPTALNEDEETMEEKLKALGILEDGGEDAEGKDDPLAPPKADSLQVLMTQALESEDKALLKQCLSVTDEKVIMNTMRMLSPLSAAKFLQLSLFKIDSRTKRGLLLVPWIKAVLLYHASYIMSSPSMQPVLSSLYQVIDARLSVFRSLLSLSGRLDLIMAQVSANETTQQQEVSAAVVYEESDDDGEGEVEDVMDADIVEGSSDDSEEDLGNENAALERKYSGGSLDAMMEDRDEDDL